MTWRISIESENHLPLENVEYRLTKHPLTGCLLSSYKATYNLNLYSAWSEGLYSVSNKKIRRQTKDVALLSVQCTAWWCGLRRVRRSAAQLLIFVPVGLGRGSVLGSGLRCWRPFKRGPQPDWEGHTIFFSPRENCFIDFHGLSDKKDWYNLNVCIKTFFQWM